MSSLKEKYGDFLDPFKVPNEAEICYYLYKQLELPDLSSAVDHYYEGVNAIRECIQEIDGDLQIEYYTKLEETCEDWFHLPVHSLLPVLIRIIRE